MDKESNENQESITGFYYYKLVNFLIKSTHPPLESSFNIETLLKDYQNKEFTKETRFKIKELFSNSKKIYINEIINRINNFLTKWKLDEKLNIKSEAYLLQVFLKEISFDLNHLQQMELTNEIKEPELTKTKKYMTEELKLKNIELKKEIDELKRKLENLKNSNKINVNNIY